MKVKNFQRSNHSLLRWSTTLLIGVTALMISSQELVIAAEVEKSDQEIKALQTSQNLPDLVVDDILEQTKPTIRFKVRAYNRGNSAVSASDDIVIDDWITGAVLTGCKIIASNPTIASNNLEFLKNIVHPTIPGQFGVRIRWKRTGLAAGDVLEVTIECPSDQGSQFVKHAVIDPPLDGQPSGRIDESNESNNEDFKTSRDTSVPEPPQPSNPSNYDANRNGSIDTDEFFRASDDWIQGILDNDSFFRILDKWILQGPVLIIEDPIDPPDIEPKLEFQKLENSRASCEINRTGFRSCQNVRVNGTEATLNLAMDLVERVTLPSGTRLNLTIQDPTGRLTINGASIKMFGFEGSFNHAGEIVVGSYSTNQAATLQPSHALIGIDLVPAFGYESGEVGQLQVSGTWSGPGGEDATLEWTIPTAFVFDEALLEGAVVSRTTLKQNAFGAFKIEVSGAGIGQLDLEVYDLTGRVVKTQSSNRPQMSGQWLTNDQRPMVNGVYFYKVLVRGQDGNVIHSDLRKLILLR